jgi:cbb3-type cytochrome oxidase maturation protein
MEILYLMVPLGLVLVGLGLWAFFWAVGSGQFDDLDSPGWSVLEEDKGATGGAASTPDPQASEPAAGERPKT